MAEKEDLSVIRLGPGDNAIVLRHDGSLQAFIADGDDEQVVSSDPRCRAMVLLMLLAPMHEELYDEVATRLFTTGMPRQ